MAYEIINGVKVAKCRRQDQKKVDALIADIKKKKKE